MEKCYSLTEVQQIHHHSRYRLTDIIQQTMIAR
jgi:hypothetical protein